MNLKKQTFDSDSCLFLGVNIFSDTIRKYSMEHLLQYIQCTGLHQQLCHLTVRIGGV